MSDINITLDEYQEILDKHDWYYMHSDDHQVYKRGAAMSEHIRRLADTSSEYKEVYEEHTGGK